MSLEVALVYPGLSLAAILLVAIVGDIRSRRIPNTLIAAGWAIALAWHLLGPAGNWSFDSQAPGAVGIIGSMFGLGGLLLGFMPFYLMRIMGAGDVKLMSVVGAFFGATPSAWTQLVGVSLFVLAAGGLLAVFRMLVTRRSAAVLDNVRVLLLGFTARVAGMPGPTFDPRTDSADRMPYAIAIATGASFYLVAKWAGWMKWL